MRRILLTGADGQVGWELRRTLAPLGDVTACTRSALDLADLPKLRERVRQLKPELVVNAAAYTAVDKAESEEAVANIINADAPRVLAEEADRSGAWFVHYSTDYVFDGLKAGPYEEEDPPNPLSAYGRTKLAGERAIAAVGGRYLIFRTSWVYANRGNNFLRTMLRLGAERDELRVVNDQVGAPTWARLIAEATALALMSVSPETADASTRKDLSGIYNMTCGGSGSWYEFAKAIFEGSPTPAVPRLVPITSAEYPTLAKRPQNSSLANSKLQRTFGIALPSWRAALLLARDELRLKYS
jgi:dTDP-4-dehydrorhamnose reductase